MRTLAKAALAGALLLASGMAQPDGAAVFADHCAVCHQPAGEGLGPFPALAGNAFVQGDARAVVQTVLEGRGAMPTFAAILDDGELAAVVSHLRTSWGNGADPVDAALVAELRAAAPEAEPVVVDLPDDWFEQGQTLYLQNCAACHQPAGGGIPGAFPALAGNAFVQGSADQLLRVVLFGRGGMPAFSGNLDNATVGLIASYLRNAWDNEAHLIDAEMVSVVRGGGDLELLPTTPTTRPGAAD